MLVHVSCLSEGIYYIYMHVGKVGTHPVDDLGHDDQVVNLELNIVRSKWYAETSNFCHGAIAELTQCWAFFRLPLCLRHLLAGLLRHSTRDLRVFQPW